MEKLPGDVLSNIFIRLLAKQLAQMRCVSKSLNAFLSQSSFIKSHLQRSTRDNDGTLLVFDLEFSSDSKLFTAHPSQSPHLELTNFIKLPDVLQLEHTHGRLRIIGSVNGLICFSSGSDPDYVLHIWNPSLSALLTLPKYIVPRCRYPSISIQFRFGYDPKTDDYRVVKVTGIPFPVVKKWLQVEVYSMRKGSWKFSPERLPSHIPMILDGDDVYVDGHDGRVHWIGVTDLDWQLKTIVGFDFDSETFCEMVFPHSLLRYRAYRAPNVFGVLAGKLCVMSSIIEGLCEVWVMDEYGVDRSWVKLHSFSQISGIQSPLGFTLRNEFLFVDFNDCLSMFDPIEAKAKAFNIKAKEYGKSKIVDYVDSLVWVGPSDHQISSCSISRLQI